MSEDPVTVTPPSAPRKSARLLRDHSIIVDDRAYETLRALALKNGTGIKVQASRLIMVGHWAEKNKKKNG